MWIFQHYFGRKKNCYSIAIKYVNRALRFSTLARKQKKSDLRAVSMGSCYGECSVGKQNGPIDCRVVDC